MEVPRQTPSNAEALRINMEGNVRYVNGDLAGAVEKYEEALRVDPTDKGIEDNLLKTKQELAATLRTIEIPRQTPQNAEALRINLEGNVRYVNGDLAGAVAKYEEALRVDPTDKGIEDNLLKTKQELASTRTE